jgi:NAD(P)-dependent dehydrogenase (short-subunit alcohol dehydrogenase family)
MTIADKTVLVTGANRGIGPALVAEASAEAPGGCMPARASRWPTPTGGSRP